MTFQFVLIILLFFLIKSNTHRGLIELKGRADKLIATRTDAPASVLLWTLESPVFVQPYLLFRQLADCLRRLACHAGELLVKSS